MTDGTRRLDRRRPVGHRRPLLILIVVVVLLCSGIALGLAWNHLNRRAPAPPDPPLATPTATASPTSAVAPVVVAISIDGLNPEALTRLGREDLPVFHRLIDEGASTLNARTAYELTVTLPNHTGMLTGRGILDPHGHDLQVNSDPGNALADGHGSYIAGMFDVAHDHGLSTALFAQKAKFAYFTRSWDDTHGAEDVSGGDDGRDKIDIDLTEEDAPVVDGVRDALEHDRADLIFLHLRAADKAGHAHGWLGPEYLDAVRSIDDDLGRILQVIDASDDLTNRATILLTADHGGPEGLKKHSQMDLVANYRIPFIAWGRAVAQGADLYALNVGRQDPGTTRPDYSGDQPIRNLDIESTALGLLGLSGLDGTTSAAWPDLKLR